MKKQLEFMLDYHCYPIWVYSSNGGLLENDLIEELQKSEEIKELLEEIQADFDSLYLDTPVEFRYIGFSSLDDKERFRGKIKKAYDLICKQVGDKYNVKNQIDIDKL